MNIIPTMNLMAERFLYLTSFIVSLIICYIIIKSNEKGKLNIAVSVILIITLVYAILTFQRNQNWKDNETLYMTADGLDGSILLVNAGNMFANKKQFDEAEKKIQKSNSITGTVRSCSS